MVSYDSYETLLKDFKRKDSLSNVLKVAWSKLKTLDPEKAAAWSGGSFSEGEGSVSVPFFYVKHKVLIDREKVLTGGREKADPFTTALILHYLMHIKEIELAEEYMSFREIPEGGGIYYGAFRRHAIDPLARHFGNSPEALLTAGEKLGGSEVDKGDASVRIDVFPKLPITVIVWAGDHEVPSSATALFDRSAGEFMPMEDLAILGSLVSGKLIGSARD